MTTNDDKGKCAEATICVRCKHPLTDPSPNFWQCNINVPTSPVTGEPWPDYCSQKNVKGTCPDYEERGDDG